MKHYVYRIDDPITKEFYFGSRSCTVNVNEDNYMGSYVSWNPVNKSVLIKTILKSNFRKRETAIKYEVKLIKENIDNLLNRNYHIPGTGFHTVGLTHDTTIEHRKKLSEAAKLQWKRMNDIERTNLIRKRTRKGESHWAYGTKLSEERKEMLRGKKHSDETRIKMSKSHTGYIKSDTHKKNLSISLSGKSKSKSHIEKLKEVHCIPVNQYDLNGKFIREWKSQTEIKQTLKINHVGTCCKGKCKTAGGYIWKYK